MIESVGLSPDLDGLFYDRKFIHIEMFDDLMEASKKMFCCFIDFKQVFDTVWRRTMEETDARKYHREMF